MTEIWVDADAAPRAVKDVLFKAAQRRRVMVRLVAGQWQNLPNNAFLRFVQVAAGPDAADDYIAENVAAGDLVITADVPLAARVVARGAEALRPRGGLLDADNVQTQLSLRDFHDELRTGGVETGGPAPFTGKDKQRFADALDRWLTQAKNRR